MKVEIISEPDSEFMYFKVHYTAKDKERLSDAVNKTISEIIDVVNETETQHKIVLLTKLIVDFFFTLREGLINKSFTQYKAVTEEEKELVKREIQMCTKFLNEVLLLEPMVIQYRKDEYIR